MTKEKMMVQLDADVRSRLDKIADRYGFSTNMLVAAVAAEVSRIPPDELWSRLARLSEGRKPRASEAAPVLEAIVTQDGR